MAQGVKPLQQLTMSRSRPEPSLTRYEIVHVQKHKSSSLLMIMCKWNLTHIKYIDYRRTLK